MALLWHCCSIGDRVLKIRDLPLAYFHLSWLTRIFVILPCASQFAGIITQPPLDLLTTPQISSVGSLKRQSRPKVRERCRNRNSLPASTSYYSTETPGEEWGVELVLSAN